MIDKKEIQIVSNSSEQFNSDGNIMSCLVRVSKDEFIVIAQYRNGSSDCMKFNVYSSKQNSWKKLPKWSETGNCSGQIAADPSIGYLYYHADKQSNFYSVKLIP